MNIVESLRTNAPPPSGAYVGAVTGAPQPVNDAKRRGVRFVVEIVEGVFTGRRVEIELTTELKVDGNRARLLSDLAALETWVGCLGVDDAPPTASGLVTHLRDAAAGKRVEFELKLRRWDRGIDVSLIGVRLVP